jgi:biofilm PGA synthesis protein PgaA
MMYIGWDEPAQAHCRPMRLKKEKEQEDYSRVKEHKVKIDPQAAKIEEDRTHWDSILVLRQKEEYDQVIAAYELALKEGLVVPPWIERAAADSYIARRQPEKALDLYRSILKNDPDYFEVKISFYYTLVDLGRYQEAGDLLESMDRVEPYRIKDRGIMRDNPRKEEIAYNKIWLLMYQDRLKKAQKIGEQYVTAAPADTQALSAMAHLYLWRGWPRYALEQFLIIHTMDPNFVSANVGYALTLYENMHKAQARAMLNSLSAQYPNDTNISQAQRQIKVEDMSTLTISGYYEHQIIGDDEFYLSERLDVPINDQNQLFAELIRRNTEFISTGGGHYLTNRFYLGDIYRPNNTWKFTDALTGDYDTGQRIGGISEVELTPDDHWTDTFHYDSRTIDIPLVSRQPGQNVQDYSLTSVYRQSELFNTGLSLDLKNYEDGNANWNYGWTTDSAVKTYAYWKWRIGTSFDYSTFSKQDVDYYSPKKLYDYYLIPNVEHTWYKLYDQSVVDRFYVGIGQQSEHGFGGQNVGYLRYEIEDKLSDTLSLLVGEIYSLENYTGQHMNVLNTYWTIRKKF